MGVHATETKKDQAGQKAGDRQDQMKQDKFNEQNRDDVSAQKSQQHQPKSRTPPSANKADNAKPASPHPKVRIANRTQRPAVIWLIRITPRQRDEEAINSASRQTTRDTTI